MCASQHSRGRAAIEPEQFPELRWRNRRMLTRGKTAVAESSSGLAMMGCFKMTVSTFSVPESFRPRTTLDGADPAVQNRPKSPFTSFRNMHQGDHSALDRKPAFSTGSLRRAVEGHQHPMRRGGGLPTQPPTQEQVQIAKDLRVQRKLAKANRVTPRADARSTGSRDRQGSRTAQRGFLDRDLARRRCVRA